MDSHSTISPATKTPTSPLDELIPQLKRKSTILSLYLSFDPDFLRGYGSIDPRDSLFVLTVFKFTSILDR